MLKNEQKNRKLKLEKLFRLINQSKGGKRASGWQQYIKIETKRGDSMMNVLLNQLLLKQGCSNYKSYDEISDLHI